MGKDDLNPVSNRRRQNHEFVKLSPMMRASSVVLTHRWSASLCLCVLVSVRPCLWRCGVVLCPRPRCSTPANHLAGWTTPGRIYMFGGLRTAAKLSHDGLLLKSCGDASAAAGSVREPVLRSAGAPDRGQLAVAGTLWAASLISGDSAVTSGAGAAAAGGRKASAGAARAGAESSEPTWETVDDFPATDVRGGHLPGPRALAATWCALCKARGPLPPTLRSNPTALPRVPAASGPCLPRYRERPPDHGLSSHRSC